MLSAPPETATARCGRVSKLPMAAMSREKRAAASHVADPAGSPASVISATGGIEGRPEGMGLFSRS